MRDLGHAVANHDLVSRRGQAPGKGDKYLIAKGASSRPDDWVDGLGVWSSVGPASIKCAYAQYRSGPVPERKYWLVFEQSPQDAGTP